MKWNWQSYNRIRGILIVLIISTGGLFLNSCGPKVAVTTDKSYSPLPQGEEVVVLNLTDPIPENAQVLGTVKIGDTGFSVDCGWDVVIYNAKNEAQKIGGNAIKITSHSPPDLMSTCDRIEATILKIRKQDLSYTTPEQSETVDSSLFGADYALFHIYRKGGTGFGVNYDLFLGDSAICRVSNNWKQTIKIRKDSYNSLWARTEATHEIPIKVEYGKEYYIRCKVVMGFFVGNPFFEIVDNKTGREEFFSIP